MVPPLRQGDGCIPSPVATGEGEGGGQAAATDGEMDNMKQRLVALIAAGLLLLFAVPTATAADCALAAGFATLKA